MDTPVLPVRDDQDCTVWIAKEMDDLATGILHSCIQHMYIVHSQGALLCGFICFHCSVFQTGNKPFGGISLR